jgi:hypothetical protein
LAFHLESHEIFFDGKKYGMIVPKSESYRMAHIIVPNDDLVHIAIGAKEILSQLMKYPDFKLLLDTGIIR